MVKIIRRCYFNTAHYTLHRSPDTSRQMPQRHDTNDHSNIIATDETKRHACIRAMREAPRGEVTGD